MARRQGVWLRTALAALFGLLALPVTGCTVKYRHEVEQPGQPATYNYGMHGFVRYDGYDDVAGDFEIASVDYVNADDNVKVTLVGVVHLADEGYYRGLQQDELNPADTVLYEGVGSDNEQGHVDEANSQMWACIAQTLGLSAQTEVIDYKQPHFRQVDLATQERPVGRASGAIDEASLVELRTNIMEIQQQLGQFTDLRRMQDAGKHGQALGLAGTDEAMNLEPIIEGVRALRGLLEDLKPILPEETYLRATITLDTLESKIEKFAVWIVGERNDYVVAELEKEIEIGLDHIEDGQQLHIAIFYGAAHNANFEEQLLERGFQRTDTRWHKAWTMNGR